MNSASGSVKMGKLYTSFNLFQPLSGTAVPPPPPCPEIAMLTWVILMALCTSLRNDPCGQRRRVRRAAPVPGSVEMGNFYIIFNFIQLRPRHRTPVFNAKNAASVRILDNSRPISAGGPKPED